MNERDYLFFELLCLITGIVYLLICSFTFIILDQFNLINAFNLFSVFLFFFILGLYFHFRRYFYINNMLDLISKIKEKPDIKIINPNIRKYRGFEDFKYKTFECYVTEKEIVIRGILKKTNNFSPYISIYLR